MCLRVVHVGLYARRRKTVEAGVRAVVVTFDTFLAAAQDQAKAMAMPEIPIVVIPHIKAGEKPEDFRGRAEEALGRDCRAARTGRTASARCRYGVIENGREERPVYAET